MLSCDGFPAAPVPRKLGIFYVTCTKIMSQDMDLGLGMVHLVQLSSLAPKGEVAVGADYGCTPQARLASTHRIHCSWANDSITCIGNNENTSSMSNIFKTNMNQASCLLHSLNLRQFCFRQRLKRLKQQNAAITRINAMSRNTAHFGIPFAQILSQ